MTELFQSAVKPKSAEVPHVWGLLQRKCACGEHTLGGAACSKCAKNDEPSTLAVATTNAATFNVAPPIGRDGLQSSSESFDLPNNRALMKPRFEHDFSRVRVHNSEASTRNAVMNHVRGPAVDRLAVGRAPGSFLSAGPARMKLESQMNDKVGEAQQVPEETTAMAETPEDEVEEGAESANSGTPGSRGEEEITFEVSSETAPPVGPSKTKCPVPAAATVGFSTAKSTAAQIASMGNCQSGTTKPDPLKVTTSTCEDGGSWRLRVTKVKSKVRTFSRMFSGRAEPKKSNSTSGNFCDQVTELNALGSCGPWYMLSAIKAHENVHVTEWTSNFDTDWAAQKAIIEGLSVPASGATKARLAATKSLKSENAFKNALLTNGTNYPTFWGIADPNPDTEAAERAIVTPRIDALCTNAKDKGWSPGACQVCVDRGIT